MKKKVLHIISSVHWRGGEQQVNTLFNNTSEQYDYYLFCPEGAELVKRNPEKSAHIFTWKKRFGFDIFAAFTLKKVCQKNGIDLIHLHDSHAINTYILADLLGMNIPAIIHRHVNFPVFSKWKYNHPNIHKIICVSEEVKKTIALFISDKAKIAVIHPGINLEKFSGNSTTSTLRKEINATPGQKIIGMVSALEKEKNIAEFIAIANLYKTQNKDYHFVLIGDGSLMNTFNTQYAVSNIHFLGFRNDIPELMAAMDVFLFTSLNEGFPLVVLEAMAAKVPILSHQFPSSGELIDDGKTGLLYTTTEEAVQQLELLLNNDELRTGIVEKAYQFVQQFDLPLMQRKIEEVYTNLLTHH